VSKNRWTVSAETWNFSMRMRVKSSRSNFLSPVRPARRDHPDGKAMQRNIEDMAVLPFEPGGHSPQLVVMFEQQHRVPGACQDVGRREPGEPTANHHHIVRITGSFEEILGHALNFQGTGRV